MGTTYHIKIANAHLSKKQLSQIQRLVGRRLGELNRQMSHYDPASELSRFNMARAGEKMTISRDFARVLGFAVKLNQQSQGAFDPTIGVLINLWGFGEVPWNGMIPNKAQTDVARQMTGCQHVVFHSPVSIEKDMDELMLNLSAAARGYAADEIARLIAAQGHPNTLVEVGTEMVALGVSAEGRPWQVGVEKPIYEQSPARQVELVVPLSGRALSTTGDYRRFFEDRQGGVYSHIIDPRTGIPVDNSLASVTVVANTGLEADGLATTLYVLGLEEGLKFVEARPDVGALFIVHQPDGSLKKVASSKFPRWNDLP